jgi:hypothetical protein
MERTTLSQIRSKTKTTMKKMNPRRKTKTGEPENMYWHRKRSEISCVELKLLNVKCVHG